MYLGGGAMANAGVGSLVSKVMEVRLRVGCGQGQGADKQ